MHFQKDHSQKDHSHNLETIKYDHSIDKIRVKSWGKAVTKQRSP